MIEKLKAPSWVDNVKKAIYKCMFCTFTIPRSFSSAPRNDWGMDFIFMMMWPFHMITMIPGAIVGAPLGVCYATAKHIQWKCTYSKNLKMFEQKNEQYKAEHGGNCFELYTDELNGQLRFRGPY